MGYKTAKVIIKGFVEWVEDTPEGQRAKGSLGVPLRGCAATRSEVVTHFLKHASRDILVGLASQNAHEVDSAWKALAGASYYRQYSLQVLSRYLLAKEPKYNDS